VGIGFEIGFARHKASAGKNWVCFGFVWVCFSSQSPLTAQKTHKLGLFCIKATRMVEILNPMYLNPKQIRITQI
jgi:hypothetical protein